jgi:hypothetical protein
MTPRSCTRCLLSEDVPGVSIESGGQCSVCSGYDREWGHWDENKKARLAALEGLLGKIKRKAKLYDVLVPLSGGKDSTYVLYLCRERFGLKCLAVTFDNGFLSDHARKNIGKVCEVLKVDHAYFALGRDLLMRLYRYSFLKTGYFCPICLHAMGAAVSRIQKAYGIPLCVKGTARRTEEHVAKEFFVSSNDFAENVFKGSPHEKEARFLLEPVGIFKSPPAIQLPDFVDWNYDEIYATIGKLGWEAPTPRAEHSDCVVDNIVNWVRYKRYPVLIPEMLRFSKLVTVGQMSREEAEKHVEAQKVHCQEPANLPFLTKSLDITPEEFRTAVLTDPLKHLPYLRPQNRVVRRLKALRRRLPF